MSTGTTIRNYVTKAPYDLDYVAVSAIEFNRLSSKKVYGKTEVFVASLTDIIKALRTKTKTDPYTKLPNSLYYAEKGLTTELNSRSKIKKILKYHKGFIRALRDYLDDFYLAYVDDILIYTDSSLDEYRHDIRLEDESYERIVEYIREKKRPLNISRKAIGPRDRTLTYEDNLRRLRLKDLRLPRKRQYGSDYSSTILLAEYISRYSKVRIVRRLSIVYHPKTDRATEKINSTIKVYLRDKVWLNLKNIRTDRPSKTLDVRNAKYTVIEVIGSYSYRLDTPPGISNVFYSQLLRLANDDPLLSQEATERRTIDGGPRTRRKKRRTNLTWLRDLALTSRTKKNLFPL
ncbi:hypothetical protein G7Y89_g13402 [Cudoniella acicularis]|uniref:Uncharacterized protein n=1 Tax=Cudoniella acicularis TaxID=354080 RepID=A0A8H4R7I2_9HELO|nr:hypothetical protein G7Y89_g13402 [Cudoniella acicularis]